MTRERQALFWIAGLVAFAWAGESLAAVGY